MTAGALAGAGYSMGEPYLEPTRGNPKGYFEGRDVNGINERLLAQLLPPAPLGRVGRLLMPWRFRHGQRWVARLPIDATVRCTDAIARSIRQVVSQVPFCLKDPRFCYTLPAWREHLPDDTVFICVFRHPSATADSIVRECRERPYLHNLDMTRESAVEVWTQMYRHVLEKHRHRGDWLFLHFDQLADGNGLDRLSQFLDAPVDRSFPDRSASRAQNDQPAPKQAMALYNRLCELASYNEEMNHRSTEDTESEH